MAGTLAIASGCSGESHARRYRIVPGARTIRSATRTNPAPPPTPIPAPAPVDTTPATREPPAAPAPPPAQPPDSTNAAVPRPPTPPDRRVVIAQAARAVVLLQCPLARGNTGSLGSGFLVSDGRIVTNAHVVAGCLRLEASLRSGEVLLSTTVAEAYDLENDLAVLPRVVRLPAALDLETDLPDVGSDIIAIGAPEGLTHTVSTGIVSAIRGNGERSLIQFTAPISHGSSGGPVVDATGKVVCVTVSTVAEGQNLNFCVPAARVRSLLQRPPASVPLQTIREPRNRGIPSR